MDAESDNNSQLTHCSELVVSQCKLAIVCSHLTESNPSDHIHLRCVLLLHNLLECGEIKEVREDFQGVGVLADSEEQHEHCKEVEDCYLRNAIFPLNPNVLDDVVEHKADGDQVNANEDATLNPQSFYLMSSGNAISVDIRYVCRNCLVFTPFHNKNIIFQG